MPKLSELQERFAQLVALEDMSPSDACYEAGYGQTKHPSKDNYHTVMGSRLMNDSQVVMRIHEIRQANAKDDKEYGKKLIKNLKRIIDFDPMRYYSSKTVTLSNGRVVTDTYMKIPVDKWDKRDRQLVVNGFDSKGNPKFIDKQWAYEKLMRIYELDRNTSVDIEDMLSLFTGAGLQTGKCNASPEGSSEEQDEECYDLSIYDEVDEDYNNDTIEQDEVVSTPLSVGNNYDKAENNYSDDDYSDDDEYIFDADEDEEGWTD